jgi:hypothetical protein
MGRYLMANSICANIEGSERRDEARAELIVTMAHAPLFPIEGSAGQRQDGSKSQASLTTAARSKQQTAKKNNRC